MLLLVRIHHSIAEAHGALLSAIEEGRMTGVHMDTWQSIHDTACPNTVCEACAKNDEPPSSTPIAMRVGDCRYSNA